MPRRLARRPIKALPTSRIKFNRKNWIRVEQAYGCRVPNAARGEIVDATNRFVAFAAAERNALSIKSIFKKIEQIKRSACMLRSVLDSAQGNSEALAAIDLLEQKSVDVLKLHGSISVLEISCDEVSADLKTSVPHYEGNAWEHWIGDLTQSAKDHGLPSGARKDSDKRDSDSPSQFVRLVQTLQSFVPKSYRRHSQSSNALATAIALGRRRHRAK